jgi:hypothetical protein
MRAEKLRAEDAEKRAARAKSSMDDAEEQGEELVEEIVVDAADEQAFAEAPAEEDNA